MSSPTATLTPRTRVAIVEDNAGICHELEYLLGNEPDLTCVATCRNVGSALQILPGCSPDVIIMDIQLPDGSGIDCTAQLKPHLPHSQILMYTIYEDAGMIMNALTAGAIGYILKSAARDEIVAVVREARRGGAPLSGDVARKVVESLQATANRSYCVALLTQRELEVIGSLARGLSAKEIADQLAISLLTVNSHLKHIYGKLGVHSRTEALLKYLR